MVMKDISYAVGFSGVLSHALQYAIDCETVRHNQDTAGGHKFADSGECSVDSGTQHIKRKGTALNHTDSVRVTCAQNLTRSYGDVRCS